MGTPPSAEDVAVRVRVLLSVLLKTRKSLYFRAGCEARLTRHLTSTRTGGTESKRAANRG